MKMKYIATFFLSFLFVYVLIWYGDKRNSSAEKPTRLYKRTQLVFIIAYALCSGTFGCVTLFSPFTDKLLLSIGIALGLIVLISILADRIIKALWKCPYCHRVLPYGKEDGPFKNYAICPYCKQDLNVMDVDEFM